MAKLNCRRKGCRDVWNAFLVAVAHFAGFLELPIIHPTHEVPNRLVPFSKAVNCKDRDQWVHFYEDDFHFERLWDDPTRWLDTLKRFRGVILPDFSVYRDMPLIVQLYNIYRSRAIGCWLQANGVKVICNLRWGDRRTHRFCCDGAPKCCVIAVGTHGTLKDRDDRRCFAEGLATVVARLQPTAIVVYGDAPDSIFREYREMGIEVVPFASDVARAHGRAE